MARRDANTLSVLIDKLLALELPPLPAADTEAAWVRAVASGWFMRVRRSGQAALLLDRQQFDDEAAPLRRSMIEHTLWLMWLADEREALAPILARQSRKWARRVKPNVSDGWNVGSEVFDKILDGPEPDRSRDSDATTKSLCRRLGQMDKLYVAWLAETSASHPGLGTAFAYLGDEDVPTLRSSARRHDPNGTAQVAVLLMLAATSLESIFSEDQWSGQLSGLESHWHEVFGEAAPSQVARTLVR